MGTMICYLVDEAFQEDEVMMMMILPGCWKPETFQEEEEEEFC